MLVTGCSSGIGQATALALARAGFPVWASARKAGGLAELRRAGCRVLELDVTDEQSRAAAVRLVEAEHGAVGVLVNNAGHGGGGPVEEVPLGIVRETFETNVFAVIRMCQLVLPGMRAQRSGLIVNIGSAAGLVTPPTGCPYAMTKYALESLSDALRPEVAPFGIRVVEILPGPVDTDMFRLSTGEQDAARFSDYRGLSDVAGELRRAHADPRVVEPAVAASAIVDAIEDSSGPMRYGCDPVSYELMELWRQHDDETVYALTAQSMLDMLSPEARG